MNVRRSAATLATLGMLVGGAACTADSGDQEAFCREIADAPSLEMVISGFEDTDPAQLDRRLDEAAAAYRRLRDTAPTDIRAEVDSVTELVDDILGAVRANPDDLEAAGDQVRDTVVQRPGVATAAIQIATYAARHCDLDLNPGLDDPEVTEPTTPPTTLGG